MINKQVASCKGKLEGVKCKLVLKDNKNITFETETHGN